MGNSSPSFFRFNPSAQTCHNRSDFVRPHLSWLKLGTIFDPKWILSWKIPTNRTLWQKCISKVSQLLATRVSLSGDFVLLNRTTFKMIEINFLYLGWKIGDTLLQILINCLTITSKLHTIKWAQLYLMNIFGRIYSTFDCVQNFFWMLTVHIPNLRVCFSMSIVFTKDSASIAKAENVGDNSIRNDDKNMNINSKSHSNMDNKRKLNKNK